MKSEESAVWASAPEKLLVSVARAAQMLDVSRPTVYKYLEAGELVAIQMGIDRSMLKIRLGELEAFIARRQCR